MLYCLQNHLKHAMNIDIKNPAAKILFGLLIVLGIIVIFKSGYKTGKWLNNSSDSVLVKK